MSFKAMTWAVRQKLPCTQKMVLLMLAERHNSDSGQCNPSHDRLADDCGLSRRSVMDQISKLEKSGFIRIRHRALGNSKLPNQYVLVLSFGVQEDVKDLEWVVNDVPMGSERAAQGVVNVLPKVVNDVPKGSERAAYKPVIEPVIEPVNTNACAKSRSASIQSDVFKVDDVEQTVWQDFVMLRKAKKSPVTKTAVDGIRDEAAKAGLTLEAALRTCCQQGWAGFKASWVQQKSDGGPGQGFNRQEALEQRNRQVVDQMIAERAAAATTGGNHASI